MSERFQKFLLRNSTGLQHLINERLAKRSGLIGTIAKALELGPRQMSPHSMGKMFKVVNYFWMMRYQWFAMMRPTFSRFNSNVNGPLNYTGLFMYLIATMAILGRFHFIRSRDVLFFNAQDSPEFWYSRYNLMFPPNFLHNRISAHYIEINHIFAIEMMKKYQGARVKVLAERETHSEEERRTKYVTNANYVYEPFSCRDDDKITRMKAEKMF